MESEAHLVAFVLGTRPEAIKLAPVILAARNNGCGISPLIVSTDQQADLVGPALEAFQLKPHITLGAMRPGQSVAELMARCLSSIGTTLRRVRPHAVVVQGDTASAWSGAMAAYLERIPVAHVEAGLRTANLQAPFPEEGARQVISRLAQLHFAPTVDCKANLLSEGVDASSIEVTGNTVVDALLALKPLIRATRPPIRPCGSEKLVVVTAHRRENLGRPLRSICTAIRRLALQRSDLHFACISHPNPIAARTLTTQLAGVNRVSLLAPLPYLSMLRLVASCWLVLTDSGGLQEEAPSFARPVLVLRDQTERTEGVAAGIARVIGTKSENIVRQVVRLADSPSEYAALVPLANPYGDGMAAERIIDSLTRFLAARRRSAFPAPLAGHIRPSRFRSRRPY